MSFDLDVRFGFLVRGAVVPLEEFRGQNDFVRENLAWQRLGNLSGAVHGFALQETRQSAIEEWKQQWKEQA